MWFCCTANVVAAHSNIWYAKIGAEERSVISVLSTLLIRDAPITYKQQADKL